MSEIGSAWLSILPSTRNFSKTLEGQVSKDVSSSGKKIGASFGNVFKVGAVAALGGGFIAANFLKGAFEEAREAEVVGKRTENVIKSMGLSSKVTASQIGDLASALSLKTGIDDDAIQSGQNLLLTFGNVASSAGKAGGVFEKTTGLMVDLSAAMGTDAKSSAVQLGKALNDPIKGISALSRVGVSFTEQQKEQIKGFVEGGKLAKAQGIILGELTKQFGGAAEAMATPADKAKVAYGELKEAIGLAFLPVLDNVLTKFADFVPKIIGFAELIGDTFKQGGFAGVGALLGDQLSAVLPVIKARLGDWARAFVDWVKEVGPPMLRALGRVLSALGGWIISTGLPFLASKVVQWGKAFTEWILPLIPPAIEKLGQFAGTAFNWIIDVGLPLLIQKLGEWGMALIEWIGPQIPPLLAELGRLVGELGLWILTEGLPKLVNALVGMGKALIEWVTPQIPGLIEKLAGLVGKAVVWLFSEGFPKLADAMKKYGEALVKWVAPRTPEAIAALSKFTGELAIWIITKGAPTLVTATTQLAGAIVKWIAPQAAIATVELSRFMGRITGWLIGTGLPRLAEAAFSMGSQGFAALIRAAVKITAELTAFTATIPKRVVGALGDLGGVLFGAGVDLIQGFINGIKERADDIVGAVTAPLQAAVGGVRGLLETNSPSKLFKRFGVWTMEGYKIGVEKAGPAATQAVKDQMQKVLDNLKTKRDEIRGVLDGFRSDFASLRDSVASTFTGNLFEATNAQDLFSNLLSKKTELSGLKSAFAKLRGFGLDPGFLAQLFQSGNIPLILDLASGPKDNAGLAQTLFNDTNTLASSLGTQVARADIGPKIDATNAKLDKIERAIRQQGREFGREINGATVAGHRGRVAA